MQTVELIGINGKLTQGKFESLKNDPNIDPLCYTGTLEECLMEFAGRVCYNSGHTGSKNRPSKEYLENIRESRHTSVLAHSIVQFRLPIDDARVFAYEMCNEPGWYFGFTTRPSKESLWVLCTVNLRFVERMLDPVYRKSVRTSETCDSILNEALCLAQLYAPLALGKPEEGSLFVNFAQDAYRSLTDMYSDPGNHKWYSVLIKGSRNLSHEFVRHSFNSAISQRSTRYVDESDFTFVDHPLFKRAMQGKFYTELHSFRNLNIQSVKDEYEKIFKILHDTAVEEGMSNLQAKKQARGALARFLPNGISTDLVYTASLREWNFIFEQRISDHADEEIREIAELCRNVIVGEI